MGEVVTLDDVCELIVDCKNRTPPECPAEEAYGFAVGTPNIRDGRIVLESAKRVNRETFATWTARAVPQAGDLIVTREAPVGRVGIIPEGVKICLGQRTMLLRANAEIVHPRFLHYLLMGPDMQQAMHALSSGSTVPHLKVGEVRNLKLPPLPSLMQQRMIGELLGALDDKIAVNERITDSCDKLAESLLDQLLAEDTEVKEIPLGEIAKINPRTVKPVAGGYLRYIDISCVSAGRIEWPKRLPWDKAPGRARRGVSPGDTIWSTVRPGRRSYALILDKDPEIVVSTGFVVLTPVKVGPAFLYEIVKRDAFVRYLENVAEGSAYPAVRPERFASATIPLPSVHTLQRFEDAVMPLRCRAHAADQESRTLAQLRDTLLPKLMSGELRVRDAEKAVEEAL